MKPRIVVDSTCDLPAEILKRYEIEVIPVHINIGDRGFLDGVELSRRQFYTELPNYESFPKTAAPNPRQFVQVYERLLEEGASEVLSIHLSATLSATVEMAAQAAEGMPAGRIHIFDSGQLSLGAGFLAEKAGEIFAAGGGVEEALAALRDQAERTFVFAGLDTLEFLRRSGRVSSLVAGLGGLLKLKPILKMHRGEAKSERIRTLGRAYRRMKVLADRIAPLERLALVHTHSPERAEQLRDLLAEYLPDRDVPSVDITPVIGAHIGPGAAGFACVAKRVPSAEDLAAVMG